MAKLKPPGHLIRSFYHAFCGIGALLRTQRNAKIELAIALFVCGLAAWLRISRLEWAVIILTIALVLAVEGLNTAIENVVDIASPQVHPLAKAAKDVAAGAVLIMAIASIAIGLLILGPPLWHRLVHP